MGTNKLAEQMPVLLCLLTWMLLMLQAAAASQAEISLKRRREGGSGIPTEIKVRS